MQGILEETASVVLRKDPSSRYVCSLPVASVACSPPLCVFCKWELALNPGGLHLPSASLAGVPPRWLCASYHTRQEAQGVAFPKRPPSLVVVAHALHGHGGEPSVLPSPRPPASCPGSLITPSSLVFRPLG